MIKLQAIGHLGKDATVNTVGTAKVINFTVAHTEKYKDSAGVQQSKTIWIECAKWGEQTAVAAYLLKGTQVYVEGTPEIKTFQKNDGTMGTSLSCRVLAVQLLGGNTQGQQANGTQTAQSQPAKAAASTNPPPPVETGSDDLPF